MTTAAVPDPLTLPCKLPCGAVLPNRLGKSAMTEALAGSDDAPHTGHARLSARWAQGGIGLQVTGNVMVDSRYLERPGNVVLEDARDMDALKAWAAAAQAEGGKIWMQISHPGRQCPIVVSMRPLAPSEETLRLLGLFGKPRAMTEGDIEDAIARYARTAALAKEAGFDGVQIHGAHGYLISQFLSPITNRRTDAWGGSLENRARFLRRVYGAVRASVGAAFPVAVKMNSADFQKGGFTLEESAQVARWLEEDGIDLIELSGGTYEQMSFVEGVDAPRRDSTVAREAYFLDYAQQVRAAVTVPIMVTGGFRSRAAMVDALETAGIDMIGLARPLCVQPDAPRALLSGTVARIGISEDGLALGRGSWGPNARNWLIKLINTIASVEYYGWQMTRMSRGIAPQEGASANALRYFIWYLSKSTTAALRRKFVRA